MSAIVDTILNREEMERQELAAAEARMEKEKLFNEAKERRFTMASRLLTGKPIQARVINTKGAGPACYIAGTKPAIMLNEAEPKAKDEAEALIYDRAKLYHELAHVRWTRGMDKRTKMANASINREKFLWVSNALEDGRIEHLAGARWQGSKDYLTSLWQHYFLSQKGKADGNPMENGLLFFVRTLRWRNKAEANYWKAFDGKIRKAVRAGTTTPVYELAKEIVEAIYGPKPQGEPKQSPEPKRGEGEGEPKESDEGEGEGEESGEQEAEESAQGNGSGGEGKAQPSESSEAQAQGRGDSKGEIDKDVLREIEKAVKAARSALESKVKQDLEELRAEVAAPQPQAYRCAREETEAAFLASILRSILADRSRNGWTPVSKYGLLDNRRLVGVCTGDSCLRQRLPKAGTLNIALCLDTSGSMRHCAARLGTAARIINGGLQESGLSHALFTFGGGDNIDHGKVNRLARVPNTEEIACTGGTPTESAIAAAQAWISEQASGRNVIILVTDGGPNLPTKAAEAYQAASEQGTYVLALGLGAAAQFALSHCVPHFDEAVYLQSIDQLSDTLQDKLTALVRE